MTMTWQNGRQLSTIQQNGKTFAYTYDANGRRMSKTVDGVTTEYGYSDDGLLLYLKRGNTTMWFLYDGNGSPTGFTDGTSYYSYVKNIQGDVLAIADSIGDLVYTYTYDTWGNVLSVNGTAGAPDPTSTSYAHLNPFLYRGYVYDAETGFYYCNSRYYDPEIGRWINADNQIAGVGGEVLGYNMFAYCMNNPVNMSDPSGNWPKWLSGVVNVVSGVAQMVVGAAIVTATGVTGVGIAAGSLLIANGAATVTQGVGQIVNDIADAPVMREDNLLRTGAEQLGSLVAGDTGAAVAGLAYDAAVLGANLYVGKVGLQQAGKAPIKVNLNQVLNNPRDEFVTSGPAQGVITEYCKSIPLKGYGKIYATQLPNGFYQLANGHHRVAALRSMGKETIKIFLTK